MSYIGNDLATDQVFLPDGVGAVISTEYHRQVLAPGAENAQEILGDRFVIAQAAWTPEVIQAYQNSIASATLPLSPEAV